MKKNKKTFIPKIQKRKKFLGIFLPAWIPSMIICIILCNIFFDLISTMRAQEILESQVMAERETMTTLGELISKDLTPGTLEYDLQFKNSLAFKLAMNAEARHTASLLYNKDTGEIIADGKRRGFALVHPLDEESENSIYTCDIEIINEKVNANAPISSFQAEKDLFYIFHEDFFGGDKTIYIKGSTFRLGTLYVDYSPDYYGPESMNPEDYVAIDFTPTEGGYTKIDGNTHRIFGSLILGYSETFRPTGFQTAFNLYPIASPEAVASLYDMYDEAQTSESNVIYRDNSYKELADRVNSTEITIDGTTYVLLTSVHYNLLDNLGVLYPLTYVVVMLFVSIVVFLICHSAYSQLKARYVMEDYRKTLMNAMAHDLKSPLMSIQGYTENLQSNPEHPKREHYLESIHHSVDYMNHTIEDILTLSKLEDSRTNRNWEKIDAAGLFSDITAAHESLKNKAGLTLSVNGNCTLTGDRKLLTQAFDNLVVNAFRHATPETTVEIQLEVGAITMRNLCEADLSDCIDTLCEPFVTGDISRSDKSGSGIGLSIANHILSLHGYPLKLSYQKGTFEVRVITAKQKSSFLPKKKA